MAAEVPAPVAPAVTRQAPVPDCPVMDQPGQSRLHNITTPHSPADIGPSLAASDQAPESGPASPNDTAADGPESASTQGTKQQLSVYPEVMLKVDANL